MKDRVLHYSPTVAGMIVNACVVLHNLCRMRNVPDPVIVAAPHNEDEEEMDNVEEEEDDEEGFNVGGNIREERERAVAEQRFLINYVAEQRGVQRR